MRREWVSLVADTESRTTTMVRCQGLLWSSEQFTPTTAILATHYSVDFTEHYMAAPMANLGYAFFGWNTRFRGADEFFSIPEALSDIRAGVEFLRTRFKRVVLLGNSGGGSLLGAYQSLAESQSSQPLTETKRALVATNPRPLEPADAFIALNAHPSRAKTLTKWLDPSVVDESDFLSSDPELDLWGPRAGTVPLDPDFLLRYRSAQVERNRRITAWVRAQTAQLEAVGASNRVFSVHRVWADPRFVDLTVDQSDRSVGCLIGTDVRTCNYGAYGLARLTTLRGWMNMWALETDMLDTGTHLVHISVPSLVVQGTADVAVFPSEAQELFDSLRVADKQLHWIKGADHYFKDHPELIGECAAKVAAWLRERGL
jgi:pimeloyl-ACP methyl ester carboxylesterase